MLYSRRETRPILIRRSAAPLWVERRWKRYDNIYTGYYRTQYGSYRGRIAVRSRDIIQFLIYDPPDYLRDHSHFKCFIPKGGGEYEVHFSTPARNIDDGIVKIESILTEAFEGRG